MESIFLKSLVSAGFIGYSVIFLGMFIGGDETLFIVGYLVQEGILQFMPAIFITLAGVFIGDYIWYWLGSRYQNSSFFLIRFFQTIARPFDRYLQARPTHTIFVSKFIYCLNHATIFRAGALGVPTRVFMRANAYAVILWVFVVGGLGYASSASIIFWKHIFKFTEVGLLIGLAAFIILERLISYFLKKELKENP